MAKKSGASAPKPVVPGRNGSSNSTDKVADRKMASYAVSSDKGRPSDYAVEDINTLRTLFGGDGE